ncbi:MobH family relaxase [Vibrio sp. YMD68]|uniref:MobH family relaxase n=1 Tax=Vibrio sp. YMD68 TaxID=3042300 RepID=UPI00249B5B0B|nr:MobH family relaxase [Vibrio sp. YMD68]WGW01761.1 MobH family relaxase [Vibrio sp. YMD68]
MNVFRQLISFLSSSGIKKESPICEFNTEDNYPPEKEGIRLYSSNKLADMFETDIRDLKEHMGIGDKHFELYIKPVIKNVLNLVNLLPASQYHHHSAPGGLLYHLFDVSKRSSQASRMSHMGSSIGNLQSGQRCVTQREVACSLAAIVHDVGKVITDMIVTNGQKGEERLQWSPLSGLPLEQWGAEKSNGIVYVDWKSKRHNDHKLGSVAISTKLIPERTWHWLTDCVEGQDICVELWSAISGTGGDNPIKRVVAQADIDSVKFDLSFQYKNWSLEPIRRPISDLISIQIKYLISNNVWEINRKCAVIWFVDDVLYISWAKAATELAEYLGDFEYSIPLNPDTLARALVDEGLALANGDELYFDIYPEILGSNNKPVKLKCLKISHVALVIPEPEKMYPIKQHTLKMKQKSIATKEQVFGNEQSPEVTSSTQCAINEREENPSECMFASHNPEDELAAETATVLETKKSDRKEANYDSPIPSFLIESGYKASRDGNVLIPKSDIETATQLLESSGLPEISEFNAYSMLKGCKYVKVQG